MKNQLTYLVFLVIACILSSCNNYDEPVMYDSGKEITTVQVMDGVIMNYVQGVSHKQGVALSFPDEESFEIFKQKLVGKSREEKMFIIHKYGVNNLYDVAEQADKELEKLGTISNSEDEFRRLYQEYVLKYKEILMPNPEDETDLTLYVPDKENVESFIANEDGIFVVANEVRKVNNNLNHSDLSSPLRKGSTPNADGTYTNTYDVYPMSNKRIHFEIVKKYSTVRIIMYAKKKMWYGWKDDNHRDFILEPHFGGSATVRWLQPFLTVYWSDRKIEEDFLEITNNGVLEGLIYTWTDLTAEQDANGDLIVEPKGNTNAPRCLISKSHIVQVKI